ncbi:hypothetical protein FB597_105149 [Herbaspirillum sp. SJZ099]|nr:hypothetical protein [Herbaspirillum sp. SJZ099]TWC66563.1 hypothetical protein FB597_105149 [Herbaspirillum sp. SJZ099]
MIVPFQGISLVYVSALADFCGRACSIGQRNGRSAPIRVVSIRDGSDMHAGNSRRKNYPYFFRPLFSTVKIACHRP